MRSSLAKATEIAGKVGFFDSIGDIRDVCDRFWRSQVTSPARRPSQQSKEEAKRYRDSGTMKE